MDAEAVKAGSERPLRSVQKTGTRAKHGHRTIGPDTRQPSGDGPRRRPVRGNVARRNRGSRETGRLRVYVVVGPTGDLGARVAAALVRGSSVPKFGNVCSPFRF